MDIQIMNPLSQLSVSADDLEQGLTSMDSFKHIFRIIAPAQKAQLIAKINKNIAFRSVRKQAYIYFRGEYNREIYIVMNGCVTAYLQKNKRLEQFKNYYQRQGFGDIESSTKRKRMYTMIAKQDSKLIMIKPVIIQSILNRYKHEIYLKKLELFQNNYLFRHFDTTKVEILLDNSVELQFNRNQQIYGEGCQGLGIYMISSGEVKLTKQYRRHPLQICKLAEGEVFGEVELLLTKQTYTAAVCNTQLLTVYLIPKGIFQSQFEHSVLNAIWESLLFKESTRMQRYSKNRNFRLNTQPAKQTIVNRLAAKSNSHSRTQSVDKFQNHIKQSIQSKRALLEKNYGIKVEEIQRNSKYSFFDFEKELRPRILHSKHKSFTAVKKQKKIVRKNTEIVDIKIFTIKEKESLKLNRQHYSPSHLPTVYMINKGGSIIDLRRKRSYTKQMQQS